MASVARFTTLSVALAMLTVGAGCGSRDEAVGPAAAGSTAAPEGTVADTEAPRAGAVPQGMVRVRGMVRLAEGSELPGYTDEEIGRTADRPEVPEGCSPARASDTRPMRLSDQRGVGGILVTATGNLEHFRQLPAVAPRTIPLGIRDCRLEPTLIVAGPSNGCRCRRNCFAYFVSIQSTPRAASCTAFRPRCGVAPTSRCISKPNAPASRITATMSR